MIVRVMEMGWSFWRWRRREMEEVILGERLNHSSFSYDLPSMSIVREGRGRGLGAVPKLSVKMLVGHYSTDLTRCTGIERTNQVSWLCDCSI